MITIKNYKEVKRVKKPYIKEVDQLVNLLYLIYVEHNNKIC